MNWDEINDKEGDDRSVTLTVQQQYLFFALMLLCQRAPSLFITDIDESNTEEINDFIDSCIYAIMNEEIPPPLLGALSETHLWVYDATVVAGNAITLAAATTQFHNVIGLQSPVTLNSKLRWTRFLAAGSWSFRYLYRRVTNNGIIDIYATPTRVGATTVVVLNNQDLRGATLDNQFVTGTFTLTESGQYYIEIEVVATSLGSNYGNSFTVLEMWQTNV